MNARRLLVERLRACGAWPVLPLSKYKFYDPSQIRATFNGVELRGFVDGSFVDVERDIGLDEHANVAMSGRITIVLTAESPRIRPGDPLIVNADGLADLAPAHRQDGTVLEVHRGSGGDERRHRPVLAQASADAAFVHADVVSPLELASSRFGVISEAHGYHNGVFDQWQCPCTRAWWGDEIKCLYCGGSRGAAEIDAYLGIHLLSGRNACPAEHRALAFHRSVPDLFAGVPDQALVRIAAEFTVRWRELANRPVSRRSSTSRASRLALASWVKAAHAAVARRGDALAVELDRVLELRDLAEAPSSPRGFAVA